MYLCLIFVDESTKKKHREKKVEKEYDEPRSCLPTSLKSGTHQGRANCTA